MKIDDKEVLDAQKQMRKVFVEQLGIPYKNIKITREETMINEKTGEKITYRKEM